MDPTSPEQAIGQAIQRITAARLGRGFLPLAALAMTGAVRLFAGEVAVREGWVLLLGAIATAAAMLAFGLRNVQLSFGRPFRPWMSAAMIGSIVPPLFTLYVFGWLGLREVAVGDGAAMRLLGLGMVVVGLWALRSWMKVVEVQNLSRAMTMDTGYDDFDESDVR
jgi:hypothetical protein